MNNLLPMIIDFVLKGFPGVKTYAAAIGLICGAVYLAFGAAEPDYAKAWEMLMAGIAALGLKHSTSRVETKVDETKNVAEVAAKDAAIAVVAAKAAATGATIVLLLLATSFAAPCASAQEPLPFRITPGFAVVCDQAACQQAVCTGERCELPALPQLPDKTRAQAHVQYELRRINGRLWSVPVGQALPNNFRMTAGTVSH